MNKLYGLLTGACMLMVAGCSAPAGSSLIEESKPQSNSSISQTSNTQTSKEDSGAKNYLVAYFSATNNTEDIAVKINNYVKGDLFEIEAKVPYTADDLKYYTDCRADREQNDPNARPEIANQVKDMAKYDYVFLGYPIWHSQAPRIISTFLESYDFSNKTIIPFCTSASSPIGSSDTNLHALANNASWVSGRRFSIGESEDNVRSWIDSLGL